MKSLLLGLLSFNALALDVIKPDYSHKKITLNIVQAYPGSWETYTLVNSNSRHMTLVCGMNRIYDNNPLPYIQYRNFYNVKAAKFVLPSDKVCKDLGRFIEQSHMAIDESQGFKIVLSRKTMEVEEIFYPDIDPLSDDGDFEDLFLKKRIILTHEGNNVKVREVKVEPKTLD
jgi:hypothetical protein